jgi:hypothetical protein
MLPSGISPVLAAFDRLSENRAARSCDREQFTRIATDLHFTKAARF